MDLMYMISRKYGGKAQFYNDFMNIDKELKGLIRISQNNVVAWVTKYELNDVSDQSLGCRVYVSDLNMPWNFHRVTTNDNMVTLLEWDLYGESLLIGDDSGNLSIWSYREYIFNDWYSIGNVNLLGECMTAGSFFHSGRKLALNLERRDSVHYYEKFTNVRYRPTVSVHGSAALDGCVAITSTGLVVACVLWGDLNLPLLTTVECLSTARYKICVVDIAYSMNGNLIVATSCSSVQMPIKCYELSITYTNKTCSIASHPLAGLILDTSTLKGKPEDWSISKIKFLVKDLINSLIIVVNFKEGNSMVQLWEFMNDDNSNQTMFSDSVANGNPDVFKTLSWKLRATYVGDNAVESISTPKMLMYNNPNVPCYVSLALKNNVIKVLTRSLKEEVSYHMNYFWDTKGLKRVCSNICLADIDTSWLGNILVASDNAGNFYVIKLQNAELNSPLNISQAVIMLEYCLVSGLDFWDVAVSLKPQMLETVCERFSENFSKQYPIVQQHEYGGFLSTKAFLYRMSSNSAQNHSDVLSLLTLYSISVAFKSFAKPPRVDSCSEKGPGENLLSLLIESSTTNINDLLRNINALEFTVEPIVCKAFQQLIQWVAHLALNILARVPDHCNVSGYDIVTDNHALNILREVMVIINIWSFMDVPCLPVFMTNSQFDGLTKLFTLISRLIQCNQNNEKDENLIDDCYVLQNQVFFPTLKMTALEVCDIASPAFCREPLPLSFIFGSEPDSVSYEMESFALDGAAQTIQNTDIIKHVYLGESNPHKMKQCNRCQGKTQVVNLAKSWAIRSWEDRWIRSCLCGGKWRFIKSSRSPYSTNKP